MLSATDQPSQALRLKVPSFWQKANPDRHLGMNAPTSWHGPPLSSTAARLFLSRSCSFFEVISDLWAEDVAASGD
jgi:hypothetical protein